jgi:glycosyltransferase involved in cell wall biosynthesis
MSIAGFTFVRNAVLYDYPVAESIRSLLPLCDEVVVAVGRSDDDTLDLVRSIDDPKIRIIETTWDDSLREGGRVLALETDKAFQAISPGHDWCLYLQADECLHEADYPQLRAAMQQWANDPKTEGLLLKYRHFYGSYNYIGVSRRWYRHEVRIVRQNTNIRSWRDAQGFRWADQLKLRVRLVDAHVHHYGWVRHPEAQQRKQHSFNRLWHTDTIVERMVGNDTRYRYNDSEPLARFEGTHPAVMQPRIEAINWTFDSDPTMVRQSVKNRLLGWVEQQTGYRIGEYKNYTML